MEARFYPKNGGPAKRLGRLVGMAPPLLTLAAMTAQVPHDTDRRYRHVREAVAFILRHGLSPEEGEALLDELEALLEAGESPTVGFYRRHLDMDRIVRERIGPEAVAIAELLGR